MTDIEKIDVGNGVYFDWTKYGGVTLNYTEHQADHWYSDTETSVDIEKEDAQKIVDFLRSKYDLS